MEPAKLFGDIPALITVLGGPAVLGTEAPWDPHLGGEAICMTVAINVHAVRAGAVWANPWNQGPGSRLEPCPAGVGGDRLGTSFPWVPA
jgi:hypothetical protein